MKKLNAPAEWRGVWTALITPFDENLDLDISSLEKLMEMQIADGITGLVIAGSTGEGSLLDDAEYEMLLSESVRIANDRIPIVAGLGIGGTRDCVRRARIAKGAGVSGFLASAPAYIKAPVRGLVEHYLALAKLELPICLYDIPSRSAIGLSDEVIDTLLASRDPAAKFIHALKDATGKPERIAGKKLWQEKLALLSGDDESFVRFVQAGGHGIVSVAGHFALKDFLRVLREPSGAAKTRFDTISPFIAALYWESNPIPVKSLAHKLGWITHDRFQLPLTAMNADLLEKLQGLYNENFR